MPHASPAPNNFTAQVVTIYCVCDGFVHASG